MASEIGFEVVYASSSERSNDSEYVTRDLERGTGWVSTRNCSFPQMIILQLGPDVNVTKIQVAAHHRYVPKKIEFGYCKDFSEKISDPRDLKFNSIGSVEYSKEERSHDEMKNLYMDVSGSFLQLRIKENYRTSGNKYNQVGVTSLVVWGYKNELKRKRTAFGNNRSMSAMPPRRSLSTNDFGKLPAIGGNNPNEPLVHSKDPLEDIRAVQKMLLKKKQDSMTLGRTYEARMSATAVDLLIDAEQELQDLYQEKRRAAGFNNRALIEMCEFRAKKVHDDVLASIDLDRLLGRTPGGRENNEFSRNARSRGLKTRSLSRTEARTFTAKARRRMEIETKRSPSPKNARKRSSSGGRRRSRSDSRNRRRRTRSDSRDRRRRSRSNSRNRRSDSEGGEKKRPESKDWRRSPTLEPEKSEPPPPSSQAPPTVPVMQTEAVNPQKCPFCAELNTVFLLKPKLNKHFAEGCPVLTRCPQCTRALEVWKLSDHFLNSCPLKDNFKLHGECGLGIQMDGEVAHNEKCPRRKASTGTAWCPLCCVEVLNPTSRDSWRKHLIGERAECTGNDRKNLHGVPRKQKPAAAGQAPPADVMAALAAAPKKKKKKKKKKKSEA